MTTQARIAFALVAVVLATTACEPGSDDPAIDPTGTETPRGTITTATTPAKTYGPFGSTPKGWRTHSYPSVGLRFAYPPMAGRITEGGSAASGVRHSWIVRRTDRCNPRGQCRAYEFAAVNDGCPDSAPWPTFAHRWVETPTAHTIATCAGKRSFAIDALRIVVRPDGLRGIIYDANVWFDQGSKIPKALAAVLNFPAGYHRRYVAVAFYFDDPLPIDTVETVLKLVTLTG